MKEPFVIRHPSQLNSLSTLPLLHTAGLGKIVFDETLHHINKDHWERELNKKYYACGCSQGAKALIIGLLLFGFGGVMGYFKYQLSLTNSLILFFGGSISMAVFGKLAGLIKANLELKKIVKEVQSEWKPEWPESKVLGCG